MARFRGKPVPKETATQQPQPQTQQLLTECVVCKQQSWHMGLSGCINDKCPTFKMQANSGSQQKKLEVDDDKKQWFQDRLAELRVVAAKIDANDPANPVTAEELAEAVATAERMAKHGCFVLQLVPMVDRGLVRRFLPKPENGGGKKAGNDEEKKSSPEPKKESPELKKLQEDVTALEAFMSSTKGRHSPEAIRKVAEGIKANNLFSQLNAYQKLAVEEGLAFGLEKQQTGEPKGEPAKATGGETEMDQKKQRELEEVTRTVRDIVERAEDQMTPLETQQDLAREAKDLRQSKQRTIQSDDFEADLRRRFNRVWDEVYLKQAKAREAAANVTAPVDNSAAIARFTSNISDLVDEAVDGATTVERHLELKEEAEALKTRNHGFEWELPDGLRKQFKRLVDGVFHAAAEAKAAKEVADAAAAVVAAAELQNYNNFKTEVVTVLALPTATVANCQTQKARAEALWLKTELVAKLQAEDSAPSGLWMSLMNVTLGHNLTAKEKAEAAKEKAEAEVAALKAEVDGVLHPEKKAESASDHDKWVVEAGKLKKKLPVDLTKRNAILSDEEFAELGEIASGTRKQQWERKDLEKKQLKGYVVVNAAKTNRGAVWSNRIVLALCVAWVVVGLIKDFSGRTVLFWFVGPALLTAVIVPYFREATEGMVKKVLSGLAKGILASVLGSGLFANIVAGWLFPEFFEGNKSRPAYRQQTDPRPATTDRNLQQPPRVEERTVQAAPRVICENVAMTPSVIRKAECRPREFSEWTCAERSEGVKAVEKIAENSFHVTFFGCFPEGVVVGKLQPGQTATFTYVIGAIRVNRQMVNSWGEPYKAGEKEKFQYKEAKTANAVVFLLDGKFATQFEVGKIPLRAVVVNNTSVLVELRVAQNSLPDQYKSNGINPEGTTAGYLRLKVEFSR